MNVSLALMHRAIGVKVNRAAGTPKYDVSLDTCLDRNLNHDETDVNCG